MFGHQNNQQDDQHDQDNNPQHQPVASISPDSGQPASTDHSSWQHPGTPLANNQASDSIAAEPDSSSIAATAGDQGDQTAPTVPDNAPARSDDDSDSETDSPDPAEHSTPAAADDLIDIKRQALGQLSPLVGHLDQTPEEKFRTTMMMIQASDDQSLVKAAYQAAQQIDDEKTRAQALLDVINEINYFTQQPPAVGQPAAD